MADKADSKKEILADKAIFNRLVTLPIARGDENRLEDLASTIYNYKKNDISDYVKGIGKKDSEIGQRVYDEVFKEGYVKEILNSHRPTIYAAEANDSIDKVLALSSDWLTIPAEASVLGIPASMIYKAACVVPALAALITLGVDTVGKNPDPKTKAAQRDAYLGWLLKLAAVEASEFIPLIGTILGNVGDVFDLYVMAANDVIKKGTSKNQFEDYFQNNFPELYAKTVGGPIIDVEAKAPAAPLSLEEDTTGSYKDLKNVMPERRYLPPGGYRGFS